MSLKIKQTIRASGRYRVRNVHSVIMEKVNEQLTYRIQDQVIHQVYTPIWVQLFYDEPKITKS